MKKIKVGTSSLYGDILEDYDKARACNFCTHFCGYGLHACCGHCDYKGEDIEGGYCQTQGLSGPCYVGNYRKVGKDCEGFDCREEFLVDEKL